MPNVAARVASDAELYDLFENAPCAFYAIDAAGRFVHINAVALNWFGCETDDVLGQVGPRDYFNAEDRLRFDANFSHFKAGGRIHGVEFELIGRDGVRRRVSLSASAVRDRQGKFMYSRSVMYDITDLRRREAELRQSLNLQHLMLNNDLIGIVRLRERHAVWVNKAMARIFGYEPDELLDQPARMLYADDDSYRALGERAYPVLQAGGQYRTQLQMRRKDGSLVWMDVAGFQLSAQPSEAMWLLMDITPIKQAEEARLSEVNRLKNLFLSNMSHELRTPLHAIMLVSQLLQSGGQEMDSAARTEYLGHIETSSKHLLRLIETLFDFSVSRSAPIRFRPEALDLRSEIPRVVDMLCGEADSKRIAVTSSVDASLDRILVDKLRLRQILLNYLSNAIKFTPGDGHVALRASVPDGDMLRLEVEDDGVGIAATDLPRLFTESTRLESDATRGIAGSGIGLALTRTLVEAEGGSVGVRSTAGVGSVFFALLPLRRPGVPA